MIVKGFEITEALQLTPVAPETIAETAQGPGARLWLDLLDFTPGELEEWLEKTGIEGLDRRLCLQAADASLTWLDQRIGSLRSAFQMHAQDKTNRRLNMLTILSAIFMPVTLLASLLMAACVAIQCGVVSILLRVLLVLERRGMVRPTVGGTTGILIAVMLILVAGFLGIRSGGRAVGVPRPGADAGGHQRADLRKHHQDPARDHHAGQGRHAHRHTRVLRRSADRRHERVGRVRAALDNVETE